MSQFNFNSFLSEVGISTVEDKSTDLLKKFGLNWEVQKEGLFLASGKTSGFYGIVRQDNQTTFATCKEGYEPFQNSELLELVNEAAGNLGLNISNGGSFKDGALVYLQLDNGSVTGIGKNNDVIKKYYTGMNSHDGSLSLRWGLTNITISCSNTFHSACRVMEYKVKHTNSMRDRINAIMNQLKGIQEEEKSLFETYFKLSEIQVQKKNISDVVKIALDIDMNGSKSDLTPYQKNRLGDLSLDINKEMAQKGETLWGLFSGITKYITHHMPGGDKNRKQSKAIGQGYKVDNEVLSYLAELV